MNLIIYFTLILYSVVSGVPHAAKIDSYQTRIIKGENAGPVEFPHQISLQSSGLFPTNYKHICGGTILNEKFIITTASCVKNRLLKKFQIKAGLYMLDQTEDVQTIEVSKITDHPKHTSDRGPNDIAVLELKTPLTFNDKVKAIELPNKADEIPTGNVILTGWGSTSTEDAGPSNVLQKVEIPILDIRECKTALEANEADAGKLLDDDTNICTTKTNEGSSACDGDNGGPLIKSAEEKVVLVGIMSWFLSPCDKWPTVYTKVSSFLDFITDIVDDPKPTDPTTKPTDPTSNPTEPTTKPTEPTTKPTNPTTKPTDPTTKPTDPTTKHTEPTTKPTEPTTKPTEPTTKPTEPTTKPTDSTNPTNPTGPTDPSGPTDSTEPTESGTTPSGDTGAIFVSLPAMLIGLLVVILFSHTL